MTPNSNCISVSIFGSCVTRDALDFPGGEVLDLQAYVARQSFISAVSGSMVCEEDSICLDSKFQRRLVAMDFQKTTFSYLENNKSDYFIIDFIDERYELYRVKDSLVTGSMELIKSKLLPTPLDSAGYAVDAGKTEGGQAVEGISWDDYFRIFASRILSIYPCERIILHQAKMVNSYIDAYGNVAYFDDKVIARNAQINAKLQVLFSLAKKYFPNMAACLDYCDNYRASTQHKWGLAPMHYQDEYYERIVQDIVATCSNTI